MFVPPDVDDMRRAFDDLEHFLHEDTTIPPLVKIALVHYQFETIHPFLDGNGRLGRLLVAFLLVEQQLLPQPLLYLSAHVERRRSDYYDRLQAVRERGELSEWLAFFLVGVKEQAADAVIQAERLVDLREVYRQRLLGDRSRRGRGGRPRASEPGAHDDPPRASAPKHSRARSTTFAGWKPTASLAR